MRNRVKQKTDCSLLRSASGTPRLQNTESFQSFEKEFPSQSSNSDNQKTRFAVNNKIEK